MPLDKVAELKITIVFSLPCSIFCFQPLFGGVCPPRKFKQLHSCGSERRALHMHELNDGQLNFDDLAMQVDRRDFRSEMWQGRVERAAG